MATFVGGTINQPPGASGFALRALKTRKTYTTSWDITPGDFTAMLQRCDEFTQGAA